MVDSWWVQLIKREHFNIGSLNSAPATLQPHRCCCAYFSSRTPSITVLREYNVASMLSWQSNFIVPSGCALGLVRRHTWIIVVNTFVSFCTCLIVILTFESSLKENSLSAGIILSECIRQSRIAFLLLVLKLGKWVVVVIVFFTVLLL